MQATIVSLFILFLSLVDINCFFLDNLLKLYIRLMFIFYLVIAILKIIMKKRNSKLKR